MLMQNRTDCFNYMLLFVPDLLTPLLNVLWIFRQRRIALCGNIFEMFLWVRIRKEDRSAQCVLWRRFSGSQSFRNAGNNIWRYRLSFSCTIDKKPECFRASRHLSQSIFGFIEQLLCWRLFRWL